MMLFFTLLGILEEQLQEPKPLTFDRVEQLIAQLKGR